MALIKCSECGKEISDQAKACPHCGFPLPKPKKEKANSDTKGLYGSPAPLIFFLVLGIGGIIGGVYASKPHKCLAEIKDRLQYPDTMKVVSISKKTSYSKKIVVSSENGFGARLRTTFTCYPMTGGVYQGYID